jgi:hypothetical protein
MVRLRFKQRFKDGRVNTGGWCEDIFGLVTWL